MRASLRLRVVAAAVATVAVVSIAAGALLVALVRHDLRATLDDRLAGQARTVASIARSREATQLALALNRPENRGLRFDEGITRVLSGDTVILEFKYFRVSFTCYRFSSSLSLAFWSSVRTLRGKCHPLQRIARQHCASLSNVVTQVKRPPCLFLHV